MQHRQQQTLHFNSQPHKEADGIAGAGETDWIYISTHSLTRRLTDKKRTFQLSGKYFNSQPHKEADKQRKRGKGHEGISTHSLTRRLTHFRFTQFSRRLYFNSQPHKEADIRAYDVDICANNISTHSLTRRLTEKMAGMEKTQNISTHSITRRLTD